jgi:hypothetical protein
MLMVCLRLLGWLLLLGGVLSLQLLACLAPLLWLCADKAYKACL